MKKSAVLTLKHNIEELILLETYQFKLIRFIESTEFKKDTKSYKQRSILEELLYVDQTLQVLYNVCENVSYDPHVAWLPAEEDKEPEYTTIYTFRTKEVMFASLGNNWKEDGWCYLDMEKYRDTLPDPTVFTQDALINHIKTHVDEKKTAETD